jgi:hypothetical protein
MSGCKPHDPTTGCACCQLCGDPIPEARLRAVPYTQLCRPCKEANDEPPISRDSIAVRNALIVQDEEELLKAAHHP